MSNQTLDFSVFNKFNFKSPPIGVKFLLLKPEGLKGGIIYHDGQFDDSRMAIALAGACVENGGTVLNYFRVVSLLKDEKGMIKGVQSRDMESGSEYEISGRLIINATGVFADENVTLGHVRLAIIDLSKAGKQPMVYEQHGKSASIVFNGEVYNFETIRKELETKGYEFKSRTDTEVILASYLEWGFDCVNHFFDILFSPGCSEKRPPGKVYVTYHGWC